MVASICFRSNVETFCTPAAIDGLLQVGTFQLIDHFMKLFVLTDSDFLFLNPFKPLEQFGQLRFGELFFSHGEQDVVLLVDMLIQ